jgi:hypothetical protein
VSLAGADIGTGADITLSTNKKVFRINIGDADDVSDVTFEVGACPDGKVSKTGPFLDLAANTLPTLGNKVPEKWEGLAIGPRLKGDHYLLLAGTDNDYSVTQNDGGEQFDVYFRFTDADPFARSIQCPLGSTTGCFTTAGGAPAELEGGSTLLPGVLHAYKVPRGDLGDYVRPIPPDHEDDEED